MDDAAVAGALVACPLGPRRVLGVVVGRGEATHEGRLAPLAGVVDTPPVAADLLELALWMARYYLAPRAACLRLVLPPGADGSLRRRADGAWALGTPPRGPAERLVARSRPRDEPPERARWRAVAESLTAAGGRLSAAELCRRAGTTPATLRRMADAGIIDLAAEARRAQRPRDGRGPRAASRRAPGADRRPGGRPGGGGGRDGRRRDAPPPRGDRVRQDRGVPAGHRVGPGAGPGEHRAGARDRAHPAAPGAAARPAGGADRRVALGSVALRARGGAPARPRGRRRRGPGRAQRRLRADRRGSAW